MLAVHTFILLFCFLDVVSSIILSGSLPHKQDALAKRKSAGKVAQGWAITCSEAKEEQKDTDLPLHSNLVYYFDVN